MEKYSRYSLCNSMASCHLSGSGLFSTVVAILSMWHYWTASLGPALMEIPAHNLYQFTFIIPYLKLARAD